ncbi:MAG: NADH-quinone oxidoreductase subunit H [Planctomycetes bacterium]|nr:NADH-quinone oxidoreductase subunit H [Planctomycetota bacterium]
MEILERLAHTVLAALLAPLLLGVIARTKAAFAGRRGPPLVQPYRDLRRLLGKGAVYSTTTSWVFRAGPTVGLAAIVTALLFVPLGTLPAAFAFPGDLVAVAGLLGLARLFSGRAALDTGSSFEGMGASREAQIGALAEPALLLALAAAASAAARGGGDWSLSGILPALSGASWIAHGPTLAMVTFALLGVFLAENARVPVDDPATHLELTMVHEVMVLDHGGPDLAFILYGAALKLWVLGSVIVAITVPVRTGSAWVNAAVAAGGMVLVAVFVGIVESSMARLRLIRVPQFLVGAAVLAVVALALVLR